MCLLALIGFALVISQFTGGPCFPGPPVCPLKPSTPRSPGFPSGPGAPGAPCQQQQQQLINTFTSNRFRISKMSCLDTML